MWKEEVKKKNYSEARAIKKRGASLLCVCSFLRALPFLIFSNPRLQKAKKKKSKKLVTCGH